jgi:hypothetical protein
MGTGELSLGGKGVALVLAGHDRATQRVEQAIGQVAAQFGAPVIVRLH